MPFQPKYSEAKKRKAIKLYEEVGPREASRQLKISESAIRRWAKAKGLKPPADHINEGVKAQQVYMAARRGTLADTHLAIAEAVAAMLLDPEKAKALSAKDFKDFMIGCGISIDKHLVLVKHDSDGGLGLPAVDRWIEAMKPKADS